MRKDVRLMNTGEMPVREYLERFGSGSPVPGGGGASAVTGALAAAAAHMVCELTLGKKKFEPIEEEVRLIAARFSEAGSRLLMLSDRDAEVFEPLSAAYSDKSKTDEEMDALFSDAASVPLEIMRTVSGMLEDIRFMSDNGSRLARSDAGCAAVYSRAALSGSLLNVRINTKCIKNNALREKTDREADRLFEEGIRICDEIFNGQTGG